MSKQEVVIEKIEKIIKLTIPIEELKLDINLPELGMDSISFITLISELEDYYEVEFPEDKLIIENSSTIAQLIETLDELGV